MCLVGVALNLYEFDLTRAEALIPGGSHRVWFGPWSYRGRLYNFWSQAVLSLRVLSTKITGGLRDNSETNLWGYALSDIAAARQDVDDRGTNDNDRSDSDDWKINVSLLNSVTLMKISDVAVQNS